MTVNEIQRLRRRIYEDLPTATTRLIRVGLTIRPAFGLMVTYCGTKRFVEAESDYDRFAKAIRMGAQI